MAELPRQSDGPRLVRYYDGDERLGSRWEEQTDGLVAWAAWTPNDRGEGTEASSLDAAFAIGQWFREARERDFPGVRNG